MKYIKLSILFLLSLLPMHSPPAIAQRKSAKQLLPEKKIKHLADCIQQRLDYMKDVAAYKWQHQLPIENWERGKVVLAKSLESAAVYHLDQASTQAFFEAQIVLAKVIQQYWFGE